MWGWVDVHCRNVFTHAFCVVMGETVCERRGRIRIWKRLQSTVICVCCRQEHSSSLCICVWLLCVCMFSAVSRSSESSVCFSAQICSVFFAWPLVLTPGWQHCVMLCRSSQLVAPLTGISSFIASRKTKVQCFAACLGTVIHHHKSFSTSCMFSFYSAEGSQQEPFLFSWFDGYSDLWRAHALLSSKLLLASHSKMTLFLKKQNKNINIVIRLRFLQCLYRADTKISCPVN